MNDTLKTTIRRLINFLNFTRNFFMRNNPFLMLFNSLFTSFKDMLQVRQKLKMAKYRVNYNKHKLSKMEALIAESNEHTFLKGRNLNQLR